MKSGGGRCRERRCRGNWSFIFRKGGGSKLIWGAFRRWIFGRLGRGLPGNLPSVCRRNSHSATTLLKGKYQQSKTLFICTSTITKTNILKQPTRKQANTNNPPKIAPNFTLWHNLITTSPPHLSTTKVKAISRTCCKHIWNHFPRLQQRAKFQGNTRILTFSMKHPGNAMSSPNYSPIETLREWQSRSRGVSRLSWTICLCTRPRRRSLYDLRWRQKRSCWLKRKTKRNGLTTTELARAIVMEDSMTWFLNGSTSCRNGKWPNTSLLIVSEWSNASPSVGRSKRTPSSERCSYSR